VQGGAAELDVVVIGGGVVGLATAWALVSGRPGLGVAVLEKEPVLAAHQTGRNSGVIHSGIYYRPGSLKARFCREGAAAMVEFCREQDLPFDICGKVIVATEPDELGRLADLEARAVANGIGVDRLGPEGLRDHEPNVSGLAGLYVHTTGITDYRAVTTRYAQLFQEHGGDVRLATEVRAVRHERDAVVLETTTGVVRAGMVVNCGGLHSDRIVQLAGEERTSRIMPFRGEYFELAPQATSLVKGLIYPVPDPSFPFLGVHLTRMVDGSVHAGPNAVPALKREGYRWRDVSVRDIADVVGYPGFWKLARRHARMGAAEIARSISTRRFLHSLQRLVPALTLDDLVPSESGVRAQALAPDGGLVDDFSFVEGQRILHVCNAPSPAATSSLVIGRAIAEQVAKVESEV
jgi:L-2-hydroxyglutarate oxidase